MIILRQIPLYLCVLLAAVQVNHIYLGSAASYAYTLLAGVFLLLLLHEAFGNIPVFFVRAANVDLALIFVYTVYSVALGFFYKGDVFQSFVSPLFNLWVILFLVAFSRNSVGNSRKFGLALFAVLLISAVLHLKGAAFRGVSLVDSITSTYLRYGFHGGHNSVNSVAFNLALLIVAGYIASRSFVTAWYRIPMRVLSFSLVYPLLQTGSRNGLLVVLLTCVCFELFSNTLTGQKSTPGKIVNRLIYGAIIAGAVAFVYRDDIAVLFERFAIVANATDMSLSSRMSGIKEAFDINSILIGERYEFSEALGRSADNTFSQIVHSQGLIGFFLATLIAFRVPFIALYGTTFSIPAISFIFIPIILRGLAEGFYFDRSTLFVFFLFFAASRASVLYGNKALPPPRRLANRTRSEPPAKLAETK